MKDRADTIFEQLEEEIESARFTAEQAGVQLQIANAVFDGLMKLKLRMKNRITKVYGEQEPSQVEQTADK